MIRLIAVSTVALALATTALAQVEAPPATPPEAATTPETAPPADPAAVVAPAVPPTAPAPTVAAPPAPPAVADHCPTLSIRTSDVEGPGQRPGTLGFFVSVRPRPTEELDFTWTVENGRVQGERDTDFLVVRANNREPVTAAVTVSGLPADCPNSAEAQRSRS